MKPEQLHLKLTELVKTERKITHEILLCIQQLDLTKGYAELGYPSLFEYLVQGQKYSEGAAQRRISAARLLKEIPQIEDKIQEGKINLTQLAKLSSALKQEQKHTGHQVALENKKDLLEKLENKSGFETEKILSQELQFDPRPQEKVRPKKDEVYLSVKLTQAQFEKLKKAQGLLSHQAHEGKWAGTLEALCDHVIRAKTQCLKKTKARKEKSQSEETGTAAPAVAPHEGPQGAAAPAVKPTTPEVSTAATKPRTARIYISKATRVQVYQKAGHCCEYVYAATGKKCGSSYQIQMDHIVPLARGGSQGIENLRVLCRTHNLAEARRWGLCP